MPTLTLDQVAALAGLDLPAKPKKVLGVPTVTRVSGLDDATSEALVFAQDEPSLSAAIASKAGIILAPKSLQATSADAKEPRLLWVEAPKIRPLPSAPANSRPTSRSASTSSPSSTLPRAGASGSVSMPSLSLKPMSSWATM